MEQILFLTVNNFQCAKFNMRNNLYEQTNNKVFGKMLVGIRLVRTRAKILIKMESKITKLLVRI